MLIMYATDWVLGSNSKTEISMLNTNWYQFLWQKGQQFGVDDEIEI